jgi:hypothetical protein
MTTPVSPGSAEGPAGVPEPAGEAPAAGARHGAGEAAPGGVPATPAAGKGGGGLLATIIQAILGLPRLIGIGRKAS